MVQKHMNARLHAGLVTNKAIADCTAMPEIPSKASLESQLRISESSAALQQEVP